MTKKEIISNINRCRACLRSDVHTKSDAEQDYWANRLVFWNNLLKCYLQNIDDNIPLNS